MDEINEIEKAIGTSLIKRFIENTEEMSMVEAKISGAIAVFNEQLVLMRVKDTEMRKAIKVAMRDNAAKKFENDIIAITYVAPTTRTSIDTKKLKEEKPDLWEEYSKTSPVKDSVRITINRDLEE